MLLVGAGLLINSFWRLLQTDAGFDAKGVLALDIPLSRTQYTKPDQRSAAFEQRDWHSHGARAKRADVLRLVVRQGMTMTL